MTGRKKEKWPRCERRMCVCVCGQVLNDKQ